MTSVITNKNKYVLIFLCDSLLLTH